MTPDEIAELVCLSVDHSLIEEPGKIEGAHVSLEHSEVVDGDAVLHFGIWYFDKNDTEREKWEDGTPKPDKTVTARLRVQVEE